MPRRRRHVPRPKNLIGRSIIVVIVLALCVFTCGAHAASFTSVKSGAWSDPATWGSSVSSASPSLPGVDDDVFIGSGTTVVLDASSNRINDALTLGRVSVQSRAVLTCPRNADLTATTSDLALAAATFRIEPGGCFSCGYGNCTTADAEPFAGKFVLRLTSPTPPLSTSEDVRTFMVESGGALFLGGAPRVRAIAHLAADVEAGQATLRLADSVDVAVGHQPWRVGDRVAIGPTDSTPGQTEYRTIVELSSRGSAAGTTTLLTLSDPLKYAHNGRIVSLINKADNNRRVVVDTRAEVALLSRNVVIEGTNDAITGLGGDLVMMGDNVRARLSWVELRYLGRRGHLARYPLHIHNLGDSGRDVLVSNVAIHSSFQRGVVIHCTNGVTLINNTVAGSPGFAYMLEDGAEENNVLINNYALDVRPADYPLIQTERVNSAGFWFVNAANTFIGNVAAGVSGVGFSLDMDPVLGTRPSTLSTCPERLPGYNATLARTNATEFNRLVNTALIKKNFVRFQDNVVHSAHSGLWMSYPFTPMFFVERPTPIVRFTAWNIAARQMPPSLQDSSSDGVSLQFDGCIRLQGQRGMHIYQPTCLNADAATWASCINTFEGTTVAWIGDDQGPRRTLPISRPPPTSAAMIAHLEPQVFLKTQVVTMLGAADSSAASTPSPPLFASLSKGGPLAALNALSGLAIDDSPPSSKTNRPLIQLNAGDIHAFTDITGDAFGAGPGAVVAATPLNASGVDPLIEAYAPGQCTTGNYAAKRSWRDITSSLLPNGRVVAVAGGLPMLCRAGAEPLRLAGLFMGLVHSANWTRPRGSGSALEVDIGRAGPYNERATMPPRRASAFPVMLPANAASMSATTGGFVLRFVPEQSFGADVLEIALAPTIQPSDGMTFVITGLPSTARVSKNQPGGALQPMVQYSTPPASSCRQIAGACASAKRNSIKPIACVCMDTAGQPGQMVVRLQAGLVPRDVGLASNAGKSLGIYDFTTLRIDL
jgi:hypothetical protein